MPFEGEFGPAPVVPPFLARWLSLVFPAPNGDPGARTVLDARSKKEGKSALVGAVALYMAARKRYSQVVIASADLDQSRDRLLLAVKFACENGPLSSHAKVFRDVLELDNCSIIQALPFDWRGGASATTAGGMLRP